MTSPLHSHPENEELALRIRAEAKLLGLVPKRNMTTDRYRRFVGEANYVLLDPALGKGISHTSPACLHHETAPFIRDRKPSAEGERQAMSKLLRWLELRTTGEGAISFAEWRKR